MLPTMNLHIFNPEHDIALASGLANFTAPHAGRQLRHDLGFLPALWAREGDCVMVDDTEQAQKAWQRVACQLRTKLGKDGLTQPDITFEPMRTPVSSLKAQSIEPWGWNSALRAMLLRRGFNERLMPTALQLETIRQLSHRRTAAALLPELRMAGTVGEAFECQEAEQVEPLLEEYGQLVMKAPWSSSGRGLRFLSVERTPLAVHANWLRNVVASQGSVMVEPYYDKVKDFGMEFYADEQGRVRYAGLSLFHTANGAYTGNLLVSENVKNKTISHYISNELLNSIQEKICQSLSLTFKGRYHGPFGVDMMVVANDGGFALHPCVEINLRRTMGHVAIALSPEDDDLRGVMRIEYAENNYKLKINKL